MNNTSLLDIEDDGGNSCCSSFAISRGHNCRDSPEGDDNSSFTVATVLENIKIKHHGSLPRNIFYDYDLNGIKNTASTQCGNSFMTSRMCRNTNKMIVDRNEEIEKLRCTSSLMDSSLESTDDEHFFKEVDQIRPPAASSNANLLERKSYVEVQKTIKKSNCKNVIFNTTTKAINRESIFRNISIGDTSVKASTDTRHLLNPAKSHFVARYDDKISLYSFDASTSTDSNPLDFELDSTDFATAIRKQKIQRNDGQFSNKFPAEYGDLAARATGKTASFDSQNDIKHDRSSNAKIKAIVSNAVRLVARGNCDGVGSWDVQEHQILSGKKRSRHQMNAPNGILNVGQTWSSRKNHIQLQFLAERDEERQLFNQKLQEFNTQIMYLKHENLSAYESVALARTESIAAKESKEAVEAELDILRKKVDDYENERSMMKEEMVEFAETEKHRVETICRLESKLRRVKASLAEAANAAIKAQKTEAALRLAIKELQEENKLLSTELDVKTKHLVKECNQHHGKIATAREDTRKWQLQVEENAIEIQMLQLKLATAKKSAGMEPVRCQVSSTPTAANLGLVNTFGAEDVTCSPEVLTQQTASIVASRPYLQSPPDTSSRQLSYHTLSPSNSCEKENKLPQQNLTSKKHRQKCCLCFKDRAGVMKSCQCGKNSCDKRAHAACLAKYKVGNISSCVSHPGTPLPPMPLVLCNGLWRN
ncbi:hypothetical protein ACHAW6_014625 [Cyclotella cf. meneghiniana]